MAGLGETPPWHDFCDTADSSGEIAARPGQSPCAHERSPPSRRPPRRTGTRQHRHPVRGSHRNGRDGPWRQALLDPVLQRGDRRLGHAIGRRDDMPGVQSRRTTQVCAAHSSGAFSRSSVRGSSSRYPVSNCVDGAAPSRNRGPNGRFPPLISADADIGTTTVCSSCGGGPAGRCATPTRRWAEVGRGVAHKQSFAAPGGGPSRRGAGRWSERPCAFPAFRRTDHSQPRQGQDPGSRGGAPKAERKMPKTADRYAFRNPR